MANPNLWYAEVGHEPVQVEPSESFFFSADGPSTTDGASARRNSVAVTAAGVGGVAAGVAVVPDVLRKDVQLNSLVLDAGADLLRHADCLALGDKRLWISASRAADDTTYHPDVHGDEVFCFRTKARLQAGEPIVICPGTPSTSCGMLYKASAWQVGLACHNCRFDPAQPAWQPPKQTETGKSRLDVLFQLIAKQRSGSQS